MLNIVEDGGGIGEVTKTGSYHQIKAEIGSSDDLDRILGGSEGDVLVMTPGGGHTITFVDSGASPNRLKLNGNFVADANQDSLTVIFNGTNWVELSRSNNS